LTSPGPRPLLTGLRIADPADRWRALGFTVSEGLLQLGEVAVELVPPNGGPAGIAGWSLHGLEPVASIDGLPTSVIQALPAVEPSGHDNGALAIDHVVITTPDFARTSSALGDAGLGLRRVREAPGGVRQGFRRLGQAILELVEIRDAPDRSAPAKFWGLVVVVGDLEALAHRLGPHLTATKPAVQTGRRIATLRRSAGLSPAVAFMTPEPR
jgi:hypothetical protein